MLIQRMSSVNPKIIEKGVKIMTTKQLMKYAVKQLEGHSGVRFFVNQHRWIKPYAPNGEKYGLYYVVTNKLIISANNIPEAKEMIDEFINYYTDYER